MNPIFYRKNIYGILGTIIAHLLLAIMFMLIRLSSFEKNLDSSVEIDLIPFTEESVIELPSAKTEKDEPVFSQEELHNLAVNVASLPDKEFDIDKYINEVKEEMIAKGELDKNNFIDQWKEKAQQEAEKGNLEYLTPEDSIKNADKQKTTSEEMEANYTGPTRIYYNLAGRSHISLKLPIYQCPDGGKVTLEITVNTYGTVVSAEIVKSASTTDDYCLYKAARKAALESRFNSGGQFPEKQKGTITYLFAAQ